VTPTEPIPDAAAQGADPPARKAGRKWILPLKVALSVALLWVLFSRVDMARMGAILRSIDPLHASLAVLVLATVPVVSVPRWGAILASLGFALGRGVVARALFIGAFFNQVLPSSIGGDAWRIWFCTRARVPLGVAASSVLIDRLVGLGAVLLCFCVTLPLLLQRVAEGPVRWLLLLMAGACIAAVVALAAVSWLAPRLERFLLLRPLAVLGSSIATVVRSPGRVFLLLWTGLLGQAVAIVAFFLVGRSIGAPLSLMACAVTLAPGLLVALAPISLGGWGLREGAFVVLLGFYGIEPEQGLLISVLFGLALLVATAPGLFLWLVQPAPTKSRLADAADR
jgi:uncharacterized membrane protein YbhN (UPF0104 family)